MTPSGGNGDGVGQTGRHGGLTRAALAPGRDSSGGAQGEAVSATTGNGNDIRQPERDARLLGAVVAPSGHGAVIAQGQAVILATGDGDDIRKAGCCSGEDVAEAIKIGTPGGDYADVETDWRTGDASEIVTDAQGIETCL